jgi:hypothetical protein
MERHKASGQGFLRPLVAFFGQAKQTLSDLAIVPVAIT